MNSPFTEFKYGAFTVQWLTGYYAFWLLKDGEEIDYKTWYKLDNEGKPPTPVQAELFANDWMEEVK